MTDTNHYKKKNIYDCEILAPAGSYDAMLAAFNAGADACYLGGTMFGARANANNFDQNELIRAIEYAHIHGKKIYLTVNTLLKDIILKENFGTEEDNKNGIELLEDLLHKVLIKRPMSNYGAVQADVAEFAQSTIDNQQRLFKNNYVELTAHL